MTEPLTQNERYAITDARNVLESYGFVVLREKSYRQAQERQRVADFAAKYADEQRESTERWVRTTLHNEIRELMARCTFLYGAARAHGATAEELAAGSWPTTGINCPRGHDCEAAER